MVMKCVIKDKAIMVDFTCNEVCIYTLAFKRIWFWNDLLYGRQKYNDL